MPPRRLAREADENQSPNDDNAQDAEFIDVKGGLAAPDLTDDDNDFEQEVLGEIADGAEASSYSVKCFRIGKGTRDQEYCATYSSADFPLIDTIANDHGGGKYHLMVYRGSRLYRRRHITISATVKPRATTATVQPSDGGAVMAAIEAMKQVVADRDKHPRTNMMEIAAAIAPFAPVIAAIVTSFRAPNPMEQMTTMITAMKSLKDLAADEPPPGGDRERSPFELMADILTKTPILEGLVAPRLPQQPTQAQLPPPQQTPEQQARVAQQAFFVQLKEQLNMLITRARANSPPDLWADVLDDMLPPDFKKMLCQPGAYEYLATVEPAIGTYRPWFEQVLKALAEPPDDEEEQPGENEEVDTPGANGAVVQHAPATTYPPHIVGLASGRQGGHSHDASGDGADRQDE